MFGCNKRATSDILLTPPTRREETPRVNNGTRVPGVECERCSSDPFAEQPPVSCDPTNTSFHCEHVFAKNPSVCFKVNRSVRNAASSPNEMPSPRQQKAIPQRILHLLRVQRPASVPRACAQGSRTSRGTHTSPRRQNLPPSRTQCNPSYWPPQRSTNYARTHPIARRAPAVYGRWRKPRHSCRTGRAMKL